MKIFLILFLLFAFRDILHFLNKLEGGFGGKRTWREGVGIEPTNDGVTAAYRF